MPIQSRSSLAAVMTVSLAVATALVFTQISPVRAQAGSGGSAGAGATSGSSGTGPSAPGAGATRGEDGSLVGTEKLSAAIGALDGTTTNRGRRGAPTARLVQMEEYETAMRNALAIQDPAQRRAAVSLARERLQSASNRQVSPDVIARVDSILGLPPTSVNR